MQSSLKTLMVVLLLGLTYFLVKREMMIPKMRTGPVSFASDRVGAPLRFFALGDTGMGNADQMAVAAAMERRCSELPQVDGLMLLGDLFYMKGIKSVDDPQWEEKIEKPYGSPCLKKAPIYPIFGNHDYVGNRDAFIEYGKTHERWHIPNRFYSVKFSDLIRFVAIDSNFPDFCFMPDLCVVDFLLHELSSQSQWKIVMSHHPLASASKKKSNYDGSTAFGYFFRWAACDSADIWLSGHAHHLEHRKTSGCNADLFISGGGGGELEDLKQANDEVKFAASDFGFLELEVYKEKIIARFWSANSKLLYENTIQATKK